MKLDYPTRPWGALGSWVLPSSSLLQGSTLQLQPFVRSTVVPDLSQFGQTKIDLLPGQVLCHQVGWVFSPQDFLELGVVPVLHTVYP